MNAVNSPYICIIFPLWGQEIGEPGQMSPRWSPDTVTKCKTHLCMWSSSDMTVASVSFPVRVVNVWNTLPNDVFRAKTVETFKRKLWVYLTPSSETESPPRLISGSGRKQPPTTLNILVRAATPGKRADKKCFGWELCSGQSDKHTDRLTDSQLLHFHPLFQERSLFTTFKWTCHSFFYL